MSNLKSKPLLVVAVFGLAVLPATAQSDYFSRDKYEAVNDRAQPDFDPEAVRVGSFIVNSEAQVGVALTDNVFAANGDTPADAEESDQILSGALIARARTDWNNHEIGLRGRVGRTEYSDFSDESFTDYNVGVNGRLDVSRNFDLTADLGHRNGVQSRANYADGARLDGPIENTRTSARVAADYRSERFLWRNSLALTQTDYDDGFFRDTSTVFEQDFRDNEALELTSRISYAVSPNIAVFGQGTARQAEFDTDQVVFDPDTNSNITRSRDSDGYTIAAGVNFETANLIRGDVAVGVFTEDKKDDSFADVDGLSVDGQIEWFPSRLTTVEILAGRRVVDNGLAESPSTLQTRLGANLYHELSRQMIFSLFGDISQDDYQEVTREDEYRRFGTGLTYKLNKNVHLTGSLQNITRDASGAANGFDPSFSANEIGITLSFFP